MSGGDVATWLERAELDPPPLAPLAVVRPDQHPAWVYLASLSDGSRPAMRSALEAAATILSGGALDAERFPWSELRYPHLQLLRGPSHPDNCLHVVSLHTLAAVRKRKPQVFLAHGEPCLCRSRQPFN